MCDYTVRFDYADDRAWFLFRGCAEDNSTERRSIEEMTGDGIEIKVDDAEKVVEAISRALENSGFVKRPCETPAEDIENLEDELADIIEEIPDLASGLRRTTE